MANGKELRELLAKYRDQKFRKKSDAMLNSLDTKAHTARELTKTEKWKKGNKRGLEKRKNNPEWLANTRESNVLRNNPGLAKEIAGRQWKDPVRKEQHLQQIQDAKENGSFKKSDDQKLAVAASKMRSSIMTPFGEYDSFAAFNADYPDINVRDRMRLNPHQYYYTCKGPGETTYEWVYYTPKGFHKYMNTLCDKYEFQKMSKKYPDQYYKKWEPKREWNVEKGN
jgi:hypothetical protein